MKPQVIRQTSSTATVKDPHQWWEELLAKEQRLLDRENLMVSSEFTFSSATWDLLHQESEQLCRDIAACLAALQEVL